MTRQGSARPTSPSRPKRCATSCTGPQSWTPLRCPPAPAARLLGIRATVFMPEGAALPKIAATQEYGAAVRLVGATIDDALRAAQEHASAEGAVLIHPFDHPDVIAGQGTVGLEVLEQVPDVRTVLVPVGGGGLAAGITAALSDHPQVRVVGVQAAGAAACTPTTCTC